MCILYSISITNIKKSQIFESFIEFFPLYKERKRIIPFFGPKNLEASLLIPQRLEGVGLGGFAGGNDAG